LKTYNLFVYGTLQNKATLSMVLNRKYTGDYEPATLDGYIRLRSGVYMIFRYPGKQVEGQLVRGLDLDDMERLDRYEGVPNFYRRTVVNVDQMGEKVMAFVYYNGPKIKMSDFSDPLVAC
jgi:gamma-glutamylcyclotransferase (GGCT)/AIG2-like uncharacterized protein YtfP